MNAEDRLVGAALLDEAVFHEAALQYSMFLDPVCSVAWKAIGKCIESGTTPDPITVSEASKGGRDQTARLSPAQLSKYLASSGATNVKHWADVVRNEHVKRGIATVSSSFKSWESSGYTGLEMLTKVRDALDTLESTNGIELPTLGDVARTELTRLRSSTPDIVSGLPDEIGLGRVVPGGISRGRVTTLFSESGNFKTTLKNNMLRGIANAGFRVIDFSFEDQNALTAARFIAGETGLNYGEIAAGTISRADRSRIELSALGLESADRIILGAQVLPNIDEIIRTARYYKAKQGLDAVAIDYIQLIEGRNPRQTAKEVLDESMRKIQLAARRDDMAYIVVSQVKQEVNSRTDHRPQITDMIGSSAMRTASKLMIGAYKPSLYHKTPGKDSPYNNLFSNHPNGKEVYENMLELHILKNVLGRPRVVLHCSVKPETGLIKPFSMREWA